MHVYILSIKVQSLLEEDKGSLGVTDLVGRNILQHAARSGKRELVAILASAPYTIPLDNTDSVGQQAIHQVDTFFQCICVVEK